MKKVQNKNKWLTMLGRIMFVSLTISTVVYGMENPEHKTLQEIFAKRSEAINFLASDPFAGTTESNPLRWIIYKATSPQLDLINRAHKAVIAGEKFGIAPQTEDEKTMLSLPKHVQIYLAERFHLNEVKNPEHKALQEIFSKRSEAINFLASDKVDPFEGTVENNPLRWIIHNATTPQLDFIDRAYKAKVANKEFAIAYHSEDEKVMSSLPEHVRRYLVERLNIKGMFGNKVAQEQLINAILNGKLDEVKQAINAGADIHMPDHEGKMPVWLALLMGKFDIVVELLELSAKSDKIYRDKTFIQGVIDKVRSDDPSAVKCLSLLLLNGADFSQIKQNMIDFSFGLIKQNLTHLGGRNPQLLKSNTFELIQQLINRGYKIVDKIWDSGEPQLYANKELVDFCLKNGVNINQNVTFGLGSLVNLRHKGVMTAKSTIPMPALFVAVKWGGAQAIENLLNAGADMNQLANPDGKGMQTPLDWALSNASSNAIRILMQRGAKTASQL